MENRRKFLDKVAAHLGITKARDWGKVTLKQIGDLGGYGLLHYYRGSLLLSLQSVYTGNFIVGDVEV